MTEEDTGIKSPLGIDDSFNFSCSSELACFNRCCSDINLFLTPYDIARIKRRLGIRSHEFLKLYTIPAFPREAGHPVILMKMMPDETRRCVFVGDEGCLIYDDRPWSCRSFPLFMSEDGPSPVFEINRLDFCLGFKKGKNNSIRKWRDSQNVSFYEEINAEWKKVTHHERFTSQNLLEGNARDIFFLGSYNIDGFRDMVFRGEFLNYFDIDKRELKNIRSSETELMKFSFRWMRHVLFGENTLKKR